LTDPPWGRALEMERCSSRVPSHCQPRITSYNPIQVHRNNSLSIRAQAAWFRLCVTVLLNLALSPEAVAQIADAGVEKLVHGSIVTAQGQPAPEVTVEIRDLRGIIVGSGVTDRAGHFEIRGKAEPGDYVFLAVDPFQVRDKRIRLDHDDLQTGLALPYDSANAMSRRYTVSAKRLSVPAKVWAHLAAADREFRKMHFDEALRQVDSAMRADPACASTYSMRAFIKLAEKDSQGAVEDAKRATSLDADDSESFIALALSYNSMQEFQKAEEAAGHALRMHPGSWQGRLELAKSYYGQGDFIRALCELDATNVDFPDAHLVRANVLVHLNRSREAGEEFKSFLREAPNDSRRDQIRRIEATLATTEGVASSVGQ